MDKNKKVHSRFRSVPDKALGDISNAIVGRNRLKNVYSLNDNVINSGSKNCSVNNINYNIDNNNNNNNVNNYYVVNNISIGTINLDGNNTTNNTSENTSDSSGLKSIAFDHHYASKNATCNEEVSMENNANNETSIWSANSNTSTLTNVTVIRNISEICDNKMVDINNDVIKNKNTNNESKIKKINKNITEKNKTNSSNINKINENAPPTDVIGNKTDIQKKNTANCANSTENNVNIKLSECFLNSTIISSDDDRTFGLWNVSSNESKRMENDNDGEHGMKLMRMNAFVRDRMKIMALKNKYMDQHEVIPQSNYRQHQQLQLQHYRIYPNQLYYQHQLQPFHQLSQKYYQFCQNDNAINAGICHQYGAKNKPDYVPNGVNSCNNANAMKRNENLERNCNPKFNVVTACNGLKNHRSKHNRSQSIDSNLQTFKRNFNLMNIVRNMNNLNKNHVNHKVNVNHGNANENTKKFAYNKVNHKTSQENFTDGQPANKGINSPTKTVIRTKKISKDVQRVCKFLRNGGKHQSICLSQLGDV
ncbi:hypothetical protein HELRODRAFT_182834 [Helobdella robusta]|uniref:Uncharacterized protein n=1 Tax=Helobdella robusta TaxID=6412 RepID=T1FIU1_HELRO|nr:hypothetical protein HELRODRAFT_182834 [Helobdella robusta]ESN90137.1 hypothetical protein HELRODRAFT_182834 [Helobdella robusta]